DPAGGRGIVKESVMTKRWAVLLMAIAFPVVAQQHNDDVHAETGLSYDRYGHALIQDKQGWVYVDKSGRSILRPYFFDNGPDYFEEGLARFVENGKVGFHDKALNIVIPAQYDFAYPF